MDPTGPADQVTPETGEEAIVSAVTLIVMETNNNDNSPLLTMGDTGEETRDQAYPIAEALHLIQVVYLVLAVIIASSLAIYSIVSFAVLVVAFIGYFGLLWYNVASSERIRENAIALAIRSFLVALILATSALPASYNWFIPSVLGMVHYQFLANVLLFLVVSFLDWRWSSLFS